MRTGVIFGASGVFGSIVERELSARGVPTIKASRSARDSDNSVQCDVRDKSACLKVLKACSKNGAVAVNCAGPFSTLGTSLLEACLETGSHYCDICDDRDYLKTVRGMSAKFSERALAAVYGCASLPAISGALALQLLNDSEPPERVRATLFIGNKNPKGLGAVSSAMAGLGRPIAAPQGELRGFRDGELIPIPPPFGARVAYNFDSPEYDLFPDLFGARSVSAKVGFELRAAGWTFALLSRMPGAGSPWLGWVGHQLGKLSPPIGCSGGAIVTELFWSDGRRKVGAIVAPEQGQKMAVLPCVYAAFDLCADAPSKRVGAQTAYEFTGAKEMIAMLQRDGNELWLDGARVNHE